MGFSYCNGLVRPSRLESISLIGVKRITTANIIGLACTKNMIRHRRSAPGEALLCGFTLVTARRRLRHESTKGAAAETEAGLDASWHLGTS